MLSSRRKILTIRKHYSASISSVCKQLLSFHLPFSSHTLKPPLQLSKLANTMLQIAMLTVQFLLAPRYWERMFSFSWLFIRIVTFKSEQKTSNGFSFFFLLQSAPWDQVRVYASPLFSITVRATDEQQLATEMHDEARRREPSQDCLFDVEIWRMTLKYIYKLWLCLFKGN